jgi:hypothetical protein
MAPTKKAEAVVVLLVLGVIGAAAQGGGECVPQLNRLLACRAYAVPGAPDPSPDCCAALSSVSRECACSTMGIINSLPSRCNVAQLNCCKPHLLLLSSFNQVARLNWFCSSCSSCSSIGTRRVLSTSCRRCRFMFLCQAVTPLSR